MPTTTLPNQAHRATVLLFLFEPFSGRNFLFTPVWDYLAAAHDVDFVIVSPFPAHGEYVASQQVPNIHWEMLGGALRWQRLRSLWRQPSLTRGVREGQTMLADMRSSTLEQWLQAWLHPRILHRFHHLHGFQKHRLRMARLRTIQRSIWPFPDSRALFYALYRCYSMPGWPAPSWLTRLFATYQPAMVLIAYPQTAGGFLINRAAQRHGVPALAYINSWDQPTTKGPLPPGIQHFIVWNRQIAHELQAHHGIPHHAISIVGAVHSDLYRQEHLRQPRESFLQTLGIPPERAVIVYGTSVTRLGRDEPAVARHVAERVAADGYARPVTLLIRPHPNDHAWQTRFGALDTLPHVQVLRSSKFGADNAPDAVQRGTADLLHFVNLMQHADVVLSGPSTLALDAAAFDTPVINVGFDGDRDLPYDDLTSIRYRYDYDHYARVLATRGTRLVESYAALDEAINAYLETPTLDAEGRERMRQEQLAPFDGRASERLVGHLVATLAHVHADDAQSRRTS